MKNIIKKAVLTVSALVLAGFVVLGASNTVYADELTDAQALQLQLLMQTPEYQAALKAQQEAAMAAWQQQYQAALLTYNNAQYLQQMSVNQIYLLNSVQFQQKANFECMINKQNLDYKGMLLKNYNDNLYQGLTSYMGYYGY